MGVLGLHLVFPPEHRPRLLAALDEQATHARVVMLRSRREVREFLAQWRQAPVTRSTDGDWPTDLR